MIRTRREFVTRGTAGALGILTFSLRGNEKTLSPGQARAAKIPYRTFGADDVQVLEALGEILLPGSAAAGLAHYLDQQLSGTPSESMLMIKYLRVAMPFADFYRQGLRAAESSARAVYGRSLVKLDAGRGRALATGMADGQLEGWHGPPAGLFYFVLRNDAVDVVYGTQAGFAMLAVPYMAHIPPPSRWGE
jgi:hypothetical protein